MNPARRTARAQSGTSSPGGGGSTDGGNGGSFGGPPDPYQRLEYMSALILELKRMAEEQGLGTLAGALGRAHTEACHQLQAHGGG